MLNRNDLPPELQEHLRRLERLRLELHRPTADRYGLWRIAAHANGVLGMWLVLRVLQAYNSDALNGWSLFETLAAAIELCVARFALHTDA